MGGAAGGTDNRFVTALTLGITTARNPACKRGLAVNLAASLARDAAYGSRVCVVDADPFSLDVSTRLAVAGPYLEDFADREVPAPAALVETLATLHEPPLWVLRSAGRGVGRAHRAVSRVLAPLRAAFDVVVCDLVGGPSGPARVVSGRLEQLDWLLVAVTPDMEAVQSASRFLEQFEEARDRGHVAESVRIGVVATGDEGSSALSAAAVAELLGPPVVGSVCQLWGRAVPNLGFGAALGIGELDDAVGALYERLRTPVDPAFALVGGPEPASSRAS